MTTTLTTDIALSWLAEFHERVAQSKAYLTELDSAIGDADHGSNMARGMDAVMAKVTKEPPAQLDELFKAVGMTLVTSVGGASGPLYGTFFLRCGVAFGAVTEGDGAQVATALRAGLGGIVDRGRAEPGDKTMYDALAPAIDALDDALAQGAPLADALNRAAAAAAAGRDATEPLVARKGRASYLGERSIGHLDPGAASVAMLIESLAAAVSRTT